MVLLTTLVCPLNYCLFCYLSQLCLSLSGQLESEIVCVCRHCLDEHFPLYVSFVGRHSETIDLLEQGGRGRVRGYTFTDDWPYQSKSASATIVTPYMYCETLSFHNFSTTTQKRTFLAAGLSIMYHMRQNRFYDLLFSCSVNLKSPKLGMEDQHLHYQIMLKEQGI